MTEYIDWKGAGYYASRCEGIHIITLKIANQDDDWITIDQAAKIRNLGTPSLLLQQPIGKGIVVHDHTKSTPSAS